ncbi:MAG: type III-A CRISPR-associated RAMP protein Csm5 [Desulfobacteraceae bacterium]|jgi:CRISPR-associated protein Csm5
MTNANEFYLKTVSPLHIGCDEIYEPTSFAIDEQAKEMVVFNPFSFISQLGEEDKSNFIELCARGDIGSILEIYHFMRNRPAKGRRIAICQGFLEHFKETLNILRNNENKIKQELNKFEIPRTAFRSIDQRPYIPGSAIKGALRTAYLNMMRKDKKLSTANKERNARKLEQQLMDYGGIPDDPFRMVKVSDFMPVGEIKTQIIYGVNKKKTPSERDARGLPLIFETILPGSIFTGTIMVNSPLPGAGIKETVTIQNLLKSSLIFYAKEKEREKAELSNIGIQSKDRSEEFRSKGNSFLIRVGRHSGAESVTIEGHRDIYIMGKKGEKKKTYKDHATTIWLASESKKPSSENNLEPFGWVCLASMTNDLSVTFLTKEKERQEETARIAREEKLEAERQRRLERQAAEAAKKKATEEEERKKEEEKRKAELEAMTPEERDIEAFSNPGLLEQQVVEIYNRLDGYSPDIKVRIAKELKGYWIKNNKWSGKQSDKQKKKIQKVEKILD